MRPALRRDALASVRADRGETLIELLVTVVILGITVVAIVGGIGVGIRMSDIHRKQATAGAYVRNYAEAVQSSVAAGGYVACLPPSTAGFTVPTGYTASVVGGSVRSWNGTAWTACTVDSGLQQLTLQVASTDGRASERLTIVVRKPCRPADAPC